MKLLKLNDKGPEVLELQLLLNAKLVPRPHLQPDGHFGRLTQAAVIAFQRHSGLQTDGIVGPRVRAALGMIAPPPSPTPPPSFQPAPTVTPWMDIAIAELGVHENAMPGQHTSRIVEYHATTTLSANDDETPWCASFVNWVMIQSGRSGTNSARARDWQNWGSASNTAIYGAVTVIKKKTAGFSNATGSSSGFHVAFCVTLSPTHIRLLGGNQGDRVKYSSFPLASYDVKAYRLP